MKNKLAGEYRNITIAEKVAFNVPPVRHVDVIGFLVGGEHLVNNDYLFLERRYSYSQNKNNKVVIKMFQRKERERMYIQVYTRKAQCPPYLPYEGGYPNRGRMTS